MHYSGWPKLCYHLLCYRLLPRAGGDPTSLPHMHCLQDILSDEELEARK